jgi:hypothetical protein
MESLYHFLMDELDLVNEEFDNPSQAAHEVCVLLSVDGHSVPETFYRLYTANINIEEFCLINAVAYFTGAGILDVQCDCSDTDKPLCDIANIKNTDFYHAGFKDAVEESKTINSTLQYINELKGYLLDVN